MDSQPGSTDDQLRQTIIEIFNEVLEVSDIEEDTHFFHRGGHSLLAIRVVSRFFSRLGYKLSVRALFDHPTPNALAAHMRELEE